MHPHMPTVLLLNDAADRYEAEGPDKNDKSLTWAMLRDNEKRKLAFLAGVNWLCDHTQALPRVDLSYADLRHIAAVLFDGRHTGNEPAFSVRGGGDHWEVIDAEYDHTAARTTEAEAIAVAAALNRLADWYWP